MAFEGRAVNVPFAYRSCKGREMPTALWARWPQWRNPDDSRVTDPRDVDDALDLAIDRTKAAQDTFESIPVSEPRAVPAADKVVHRAEDVTALADEAEPPKA
jgi:hypothetical protein